MSRPIVFISYSHKDEIEKDRLLSHLGVLQCAGLIDLWSDDRIGAGSDWEEEISKAMAQAQVAILLITANFLTSDFILRTEVPELLKRHHGEGLIVFPVIAKACAWETVDWLRQMNVQPKNGTPVWSDDGSHIDEDLAAIAQKVAIAIKQGADNNSSFAATDGSVHGKSSATGEKHPPKPKQSGPWRILVVEDESDWQKRLKRMLKEVNCTVVVASNYDEAKDELDDSSHFDLATIDLNLDKSTEYVDGLELVAKIRKTFGPGFPIIVITGHGDLRRQRRAFKDYCVVDFIEKARFEIEEFQDTVVKTITNSLT